MSASVSAILSEKHGIDARPGEKVECPFCHHRTMCIKRDDTLAKCFHPTCGLYITPSQNEAGSGFALFRIMDEIFTDFHKALLDLREAKYKSAYHFVLEEREIHPQVIADSMLGAVPSQYDVAARFKPHIEELEAAIKAEGEQKKERGRKRKQSGPNLHEQLAYLSEARGKLTNCIRGRAGWLAFFYTDAAHRVVAVRFRKPYAKQITYFKPTRIGGVFNHGLFTPYQTPHMRQLNDLLIVLEGEFNQLQLQSLCARMAEKEGNPPESGYLFACAVGGVNNTDTETIRRLARTPVVGYDNDTSGAGFQLVETVRRAVTVTAFTTPKPDSDLDDFIRGFGRDVDQAYGAVRELIQNRELFVRPYDAVKGEIDNIRRNEGGKDGYKRFEAHRLSAEKIVSDLNDRGRFYHDGSNAYVFYEAEKSLVAIQRGNQDLELALIRYGVAPSDDLHRHVVDAMRLEALDNGTHTAVYAFTHYDAKKNTLYVYDFGHQIFRVTAADVEPVDNGTDGVLFLHNPAWKPFTRLSGQATDHSAFSEVILSPMRFRDDRLTADDQRLLFMLWFFSLFFPELFPTRVILAVIGDRGSGKTFALRKVGQLLFGASFNVMQLSEDPKDFDAAVTHAPFVAIDNSDTKVPWLDDRLAVVATGGSIKRRELYTTNRLVEFPVRAFVGITSRTPHFRREDVADRLLLLYVQRFEEFTPESKLLAELEARRDEVMTEVLCHLQEIVQAFEDQGEKVYTTRFRMADFAGFALRLANAQGWGDKMMSMLDRLAGEQSSFTLEGEPIFDLLELWLADKGGKNIGREVTTNELCRELADLAVANGIEFFFKDKTRSFAQRLRNLMSTLREFFDIAERPGKARRRYLSFRPKSVDRGKKGQIPEPAPDTSPQSPVVTDLFTHDLSRSGKDLSHEGEEGEMTFLS